MRLKCHTWDMIVEYGAAEKRIFFKVTPIKCIWAAQCNITRIIIDSTPKNKVYFKATRLLFKCGKFDSLPPIPIHYITDSNILSWVVFFLTATRYTHDTTAWTTFRKLSMTVLKLLLIFHVHRILLSCTVYSVLSLWWYC